jgi:hypothetical protein
MQFASRNEVKLWIIENQRGRRNLTDAWKYKLSQTSKEILMEIGKAKQKRTLKQNVDTTVLSTIDKTEDKPVHNTRESHS